MSRSYWCVLRYLSLVLRDCQTFPDWWMNLWGDLCFQQSSNQKLSHQSALFTWRGFCAKIYSLCRYLLPFFFHYRQLLGFASLLLEVRASLREIAMTFLRSSSSFVRSYSLGWPYSFDMYHSSMVEVDKIVYAWLIVMICYCFCFYCHQTMRYRCHIWLRWSNLKHYLFSRCLFLFDSLVKLVGTYSPMSVTKPLSFHKTGMAR